MISTLQICSRENGPIVRQGQRKRRRRVPSRTPQNNHPWIANLAWQREHAAFQNTAPAQQNDTPSFKSYDSRTGAQKLTRIQMARFRFPPWNCDRDTRGHMRTLGDVNSTTPGHVLTPRPTSKREPFGYAPERNLGGTDHFTQGCLFPRGVFFFWGGGSRGLRHYFSVFSDISQTQATWRPLLIQYPTEGLAGRVLVQA